jgi:hypothetical protein
VSVNGGDAAILNARFDEWRAKRIGESVPDIIRYETVDWLFQEYKAPLIKKEYQPEVAPIMRKTINY